MKIVFEMVPIYFRDKLEMLYVQNPIIKKERYGLVQQTVCFGFISALNDRETCLFVFPDKGENIHRQPHCV